MVINLILVKNSYSKSNKTEEEEKSEDKICLIDYSESRFLKDETSFNNFFFCQKEYVSTNIFNFMHKKKSIYIYNI